MPRNEGVEGYGVDTRLRGLRGTVPGGRAALLDPVMNAVFNAQLVVHAYWRGMACWFVLRQERLALVVVRCLFSRKGRRKTG